MITNRPLPPKRIFVGDPFPSGFGAGAYFFASAPPTGDILKQQCGMEPHVTTQGGVWEPIIDYIGHPGMCLFLAFVADNDTLSAHKFGIRFAVDGNVVYIRNRISVPASSEYGNVLIGNMFFNSSDDLVAACSSWCPFDNALRVHVYRDEVDPDFLVRVLARTYWTR